MTSIRRVKDSPVTQGIDEVIKDYEFDFADWGTPSSPVCTLYDVTAGFVDVSATCLSGSASVSGTVVTAKTVSHLSPDVLYRLVVEVTIGGSTESAYLDILGEY